MAEKINIYIYPHKLTPENVLSDGPDGQVYEISANSLFLWVDFHPEMKFTHRTGYILISAEGIHHHEGGWWPVLDGESILSELQDMLAPVISLPAENQNASEGEE